MGFLADRLYKFVAVPPTLSDPEEMRIAAALQKMIPMIFVGALINFLGSLIVQSNIGRYLAVLCATFIICIVGIFVLRRVNPRRAALFIVIAGWIFSTLLCVTGGGFHSPIFLLYSIISYIAGVMLGKKTLLRFTILTILTVLALALLDEHHLLPASTLELTPYSQFFNFTSLLVLVWSLQHILTNSLTHALELAREELASREKAEEALRKSEQRLKQSQRVAGLGHYEFDLRTGIWSCSEMLNEVFGIGPEYEKNFISWGKIVLPADRAMMLDYLKKKVLKERKPLDKEYRIARQNDGVERWMHGLGELEFGADGKPAKIFGIIQDITDHKRIEETLAAERERLAVTLRSIGDGVITTDLDGKIVLMNRVAENLTGWMQHEAAGQPLDDVFRIVHEYTREVLPNPAEHVLRTRRVIELANHTLLISRYGQECIISDSGAPIFDLESNIIGVVLVFRDSTEKQKLSEHMQRSDKLQSIGVLAGGLAHDFNNLLGGLFGYLELALRSVTPDAKVHGYIEKALSAYTRTKDLTQQLLTFSKGGAPNRKTGSLGSLLRENTVFALSGTSVRPHFDIPDDLWLCDFDEGQIGQVIDNLVINAQQAMPLGGSITIAAENTTLAPENSLHLPAGKYVRFSVKDTGTGISPVLLQRIFDPFFTTKQKGSGLGLTTVYSIAEKHGGTATVESIQEKGTSFHIYLPASDRAIADHASIDTTMHHGSGRILVMDDEESILETTKDMLEHLGYTVECATDGAGALALFKRADADGVRFDAVIMDLTIRGGMGGKEAAGKLRSEFPDAVVFVSSGYSNDPVLANPGEYGFTDKIQKPFRMDELSRLLQHVRMPGER